MSNIQMRLTKTVTQEIQHVCISHPHVITFGHHSADIWELTADSVEHRAALIPYVEHQSQDLDPLHERQEDVFFDDERELVIIPSNISHPHSISVYGLRDGKLVRKVEVPGNLEVWSIQYNNGHALVASRGEYDEEMNAKTTLYLYDLADGGNIVREFALLLHLVGGSSQATFVPAILTPTKDVLATSSNYSEDEMSLFRWRGGSSRRSPQGKVVGIGCGDHIRTSCSVLLDNRSFAMSAFEFTMGDLQVGDASQSIIYRFETPSLEERWYSRPISGEVNKMRYVTSHNAIIAIGRVDEGKDPSSNFDWATTVTVIDASSGALERADKINYRKHGCSVQGCDVSQSGDNVDIVVLFMDGSVSVTTLDMFLLDGFERVEESLKVSRISEKGVRLGCGAVGKQFAVLGDTENSEALMITW